MNVYHRIYLLVFDPIFYVYYKRGLFTTKCNEKLLFDFESRKSREDKKKECRTKEKSLHIYINKFILQD